MFIREDFLLHSKLAKKLYAEAAKMPIIDYHCHISPKEIAENRKFDNITQVWLGGNHFGDHYKWVLMRTNGVPEKEITGDADDYTRFLRFAETLPKAIGNPIYHWCHLELKRFFGYDGVLNADTAKDVYDLCNRKLQQEDMTVRGIIARSNVKMIGTTDDPIDDLRWHKVIAKDKSIKTRVYPTFRPDKAVNIEKEGFAAYIAKLAEAAEMEIQSVADVKTALAKRLDFFCEMGCRATDHGLDYVVYEIADEETVNNTFLRVMRGETVTQKEADAYKTAIMLFLGEEIAKHGIVMQIHYGAQRNTNTLKYRMLGPDTGLDCMSVRDCGEAMVKFLNALEMKNALPKTTLYSINPNDNALIDTVIGCFQGSGVAGKLQHGAPWWFNDTKSGMLAHMQSLANVSLLGNFIGMLTDSRSFLSYTRHEYFRRIFCNMIAEWAEAGEYPNDRKALTEIVRGVSYGNAARYFNLED